MSTHHHHHQHQHHQEYHHHEHDPGGENIFAFPINNNGFQRYIDLTRSDPNPTQTQTQTPHENLYETSGMLSEMFNFVRPATNTPPAADILDYRRAAVVGQGSDWVSNMNASNPNPNSNLWGAHISSPPEMGGIIEGQGLSLSLSSSLSLQHSEEFRNIGGGVHSPQNLFFKSLAGPTHQPILHNLQEIGSGMGFGSSSLGVVNVLRSSKYAKPAQELLEEFCSVGRGHMKKPKLGTPNSSDPNPSRSEGDGGSSSSKEPHPPLSAADRMEHQRRKVKLLSMLDEVEKRYSQYCKQMEMVVKTLDMVMGYGAAMPYTTQAQKAMSRHFKCLKDAVQAQIKRSCEILGEKDSTGGSGLTKGETPRLKMLEHRLRQQRSFHQTMGGMMDHSDAWRPQRGLPERSLTILRAWLFEHFLHPYPSDADKHMLARQTGLSRNQVSNWFINARVRLWKPMIEEMYQQDSIDDEDDEEKQEEDTDKKQTNNNNTNLITTTNPQQKNEAQNPMPSSSSSVSASHNNNNNNAVTVSDPKRWAETMTRVGPPQPHHDNNLAFNNGQQNHHQLLPVTQQPAFYHVAPDDLGPSTMIRFGSAHATGDVSLTLGLRHAGNNGPDQLFHR